MTKKELAALEKVFAAELGDRLPFQSRAAIYKRLCDEGLLAPMQKTFGEGWSRLTVDGYQLTHAGRFAYCSNCSDEAEP